MNNRFERLSIILPREPLRGPSSSFPRLLRYAPSRITPSTFQPHAVRRKAILERYPEIRELYGSDPRSAWFCMMTILLQFAVAYLVRDMQSFSLLLFVTYAVSGTLNHSLFLAMHEVTHDLFFASRFWNKVFAHLVNLPMGVPASGFFKLYHRAHHTDLGRLLVDTDIPSALEAGIFRGKLGRLIWLSVQSVTYISRPLLQAPLPATRGIVVASFIQYLFDIAVVYFLSWRSLFYLIVGSLLGGSLHPISGHFLAEHFEFIPGQETYSYYGPMNWICYNVGYHVEHHDFPRIPCTRLHRLKEIAPEWYSMPCYTSWLKVMYDFVVSDNMSLFARVARKSSK
jgi:sphingolipid 4-desaturase/C4-monooxygenase